MRKIIIPLILLGYLIVPSTHVSAQTPQEIQAQMKEVINDIKKQIAEQQKQIAEAKKVEKILKPSKKWKKDWKC